MEGEEGFSLTDAARFLQGALCCLMVSLAAPAPLVNLNPLLELLLRELGDPTELTEIMLLTLTISTVGPHHGFSFHRTGGGYRNISGWFTTAVQDRHRWLAQANVQSRLSFPVGSYTNLVVKALTLRLIAEPI